MFFVNIYLFLAITAVGRENYPHFTVDIESEDSEEDAEIDKCEFF